MTDSSENMSTSQQQQQGNAIHIERSPLRDPQQPSNDGLVENNNNTSAAAAPTPRIDNRLSAAEVNGHAHNYNNNHNNNDEEEDWNFTTAFEDNIGKPSREALHNFFYPLHRDEEDNEEPQQQQHLGSMSNSSSNNNNRSAEPTTTDSPNEENSNNHVQQHFDEHFAQQATQDKQFVERFWTTYDDIVILAIFTQVGIIFRLASATWFAIFDNVFSNDSALFVNLPLNCLSCFIMGMLCSGERLMEIIVTRFSPPRLQQQLQQQYNDDDENTQDHDPDDEEQQEMLLQETESHSLDSRHSRRTLGSLLRRRRRRRRRRRKTEKYFHSWQPPVHLNEDLRDVQLLALERRIRQSKCLLLFPVKKEDVDVMEHYFQEGYKRDNSDSDDDDEGDGGDGLDLSFDLELQVERADAEEEEKREIENNGLPATPSPPKASSKRYVNPEEALSPASTLSTDSIQNSPEKQRTDPLTGTIQPTEGHDHDEDAMHEVHLDHNDAAAANNTDQDENDNVHLHGELQQDLNQIVHDVSANVTENISRLQRVNLADGWDMGTTPEAMSDDLMLGLRDGFCGALSSFSSWNSSMVSLLRGGKIGEAFVGYILGLQLPIVAYRFGQHVAVYIFIWRCRREAKGDERRGYGIRVSMNEYSDRDAADHDQDSPQALQNKTAATREIPSIRAVATAIFIMALVTQCTSLSFFSDPDNQQIAISLLFSPLGVLTRWRLSKYNNWRPYFPIGTFTANILACALSGSLGSLLAGNPDDRERIVLQSIINGFGGTLSSLATFIVEVLAGVDPVLFRFDGIFYAAVSIFAAMLTGFVFSASVDWADETE